MLETNKTEAGDVSSRGFPLNGEGNNSTNGTSEFAFAEAQLNASLADNPPMAALVKRVAGIGTSITGTVGAMVDVLRGSNNGDLPLATSKEFGNLCGSLSRGHKAAAESLQIASRILDSQAGATSGQISQAVSESPCRPDSDFSQPLWDRVYGGVNNGPTRVNFVTTEPAEAPEAEEVERESHIVKDVDSGVRVQSNNPLEVADAEAPHSDNAILAVEVDRQSYGPNRSIWVTTHGVVNDATLEIVPFHPGMDQAKGDAVAHCKDVGPEHDEVEFNRVESDFKPGLHFAKLTDGDKSFVVSKPFMVRATLRTLRGMEGRTGYSVSTFNKYIANGGIKPENVVGKSKNCNKIRLTEAAIGDLVDLGVQPHKKRRARLERFLSRHSA
jgi:hypothetical protein